MRDAIWSAPVISRPGRTLARSGIEGANLICLTTIKGRQAGVSLLQVYLYRLNLRVIARPTHTYTESCELYTLVHFKTLPITWRRKNFAKDLVWSCNPFTSTSSSSSFHPPSPPPPPLFILFSSSSSSSFYPPFSSLLARRTVGVRAHVCVISDRRPTQTLGSPFRRTSFSFFLFLFAFRRKRGRG